MMLESEFYHSHVKPHLEQWGDHNRVENSAESGTPDISYAIAGVQGWLELKVIRDGLLSFEKFQLAWLKKRWRHAKGNLWVFATDGEALYVYSVDRIIATPRHVYRRWLKMPIALIEPNVHGPTKPWPWGKVLSTLTPRLTLASPPYDPEFGNLSRVLQQTDSLES